MGLLILVAVVFIILFVLGVMAYFNTSISFVKNIRGLLGLEQKPATLEKQEEANRLLQEIRSLMAPPQEGAVDLGIDELAKATSPDTLTLLSEAIQLHRNNRQREAIATLMEAFHRDLEPEAKAELHMLLADSYLYLGDLNQARSHFSQGLDVAQLFHLEEEQAGLLLDLAIVDAQRGRTHEAEEQFLESIRLFEQLGRMELKGTALGNLGVFHMVQGELESAELELQEALSIGKELEVPVIQARSVAGLGLVAFWRREFDRAISLHNEALRINRSLSNVRAESQDLANIGIAYLEKGADEEAESYFNESLAIAQKIQDRLTEGRQLANLGVLTMRRGHEGQACGFYRRALLLFEEAGAAPEATQTREHLEKLGCDEEAQEPPASEDAPGG